MALLIHEFIHLFLSLVIGGFFYLKGYDWWLILVALLFGFFIDMDHWFDYFAFFGLKINLRKFFKIGQYVRLSKKVYVPLHGWEYVVLLWLGGRWFGVAGLEWAMSLSYLGHLLFDNFSFKHHPLAYFFTYRLLNNFSLESFDNLIKSS